MSIARIGSEASVPAAAIRLQKWRKALAGVRTGTGRAKIAYIGDSTTAGQGAGTGGSGNMNAARAKSAPAWLAAALTSLGVSANVQSVWGGSGTLTAGVSYAAYDPRVTLPGDWTQVPLTAGGDLFSAGGTITTSLIFAPGVQCDTFKVYFVKSGGNGTATININGGATLATVDTSGGAGAILSQVVTGALGVNDVRVQRSAGSTIFIIGIEAYNSAVPGVDVWNMGVCGWKASNWANSTQAWTPATALATLAPDLTIANIGINDWGNGTSLASFATDIQTVITAAKAGGGGCIVLAPTPTSGASVATQASYIATLQSLATQNGCPYISLTDRFVDWTTMNSTGFAYDILHPSLVAYADIGGQALLAPILN